jgi:hypothetical protein
VGAAAQFECAEEGRGGFGCGRGRPRVDEIDDRSSRILRTGSIAGQHLVVVIVTARHLVVLQLPREPGAVAAAITLLLAGCPSRLVDAQNGEGRTAEEEAAAQGLRHLFTWPYRARANGKADRLNRMIINGTIGRRPVRFILNDR